MTQGFTGIIDQLERQKAAIERALAALREVGEVDAPIKASAATPTTAETSGRKKRSAAVRKRMQEAQRLRWAKIRGESEPTAPVTKEVPKPKRKISPEGIKRIIAATKKRWRLRKEAEKAALAKKAAPKKVTVKKAVVKAPAANAAKKIAPVKKAAVKKLAPAPVSTLTLAETSS
jgi:hypothetical protein